MRRKITAVVCRNTEPVDRSHCVLFCLQRKRTGQSHHQERGRRTNCKLFPVFCILMFKLHVCSWYTTKVCGQGNSTPICGVLVQNHQHWSAAITASTRFYNLSAEIRSHSATRASVSPTPMLVIRSGSQSTFQFIPKVLDGSVQTSQYLSHQTGKKTTSLWSWMCAQGHCHVETGKGLPRCLKYLLSKISLYAWAVRDPNQEKQPQTQSTQVCGQGVSTSWCTSKVKSAILEKLVDIWTQQSVAQCSFKLTPVTRSISLSCVRAATYYTEVLISRLQSQACVWTPASFFQHTHTQRKASGPWGDIWQSVLD